MTGNIDSNNKQLLVQLEKINVFIAKMEPYIINFEKKLKENKLSKQTGRKKKYGCKEVLKYIYLASLSTSWEKLQLYNPNDSKLIQTAKKYFYKLCKNEVFLDAYKNELNIYDNKYNQKVFSIDSRTVKNINGTECTNFCYKIKSKKSIKTTVICDENKVVYALLNHPSNQADISVTEQVVNDMLIHKNTYHNQYYIAGDKGYISNDVKTKLKEDNINIVTPVKDNAKKLTPEIKKELKELTKETKLQINDVEKIVKNLKKIETKLNNKLSKTKRDTTKNAILIEIDDIVKQIKDNKNNLDVIYDVQRKKENQIRRKMRKQLSKIQEKALKLRYNVENYFSYLNRRYKRCEAMYNKKEVYLKNFILLASFDILINVT